MTLLKRGFDPMCLHVLGNINNQPIEVAKADITVYKILTDDNISPYQRFSYEPNTLYRLRKPLVISTQWSKGIISEGFHAYLDKSETFCRVGFHNPQFKAVELTIPKGAKYVLGQNDDIVSTSIRSGSLEPIKG